MVDDRKMEVDPGASHVKMTSHSLTSEPSSAHTETSVKLSVDCVSVGVKLPRYPDVAEENVDVDSELSCEMNASVVQPHSESVPVHDDVHVGSVQGPHVEVLHVHRSDPHVVQPGVLLDQIVYAPDHAPHHVLRDLRSPWV